MICGAIYPITVTGIAQAAFAGKANGSVIYGAKGEAIGSALIAQKFRGDQYFWPRPSAGDYATMASGASNKGSTSADLLFASGSGLDPHISKDEARFQVRRIATARKFDGAKKASLYALVERMTEAATWGIFGEPRVNVLLINLELDKM